MAALLPVKGTQLSSAPCSIERAAGLLRRFLSSEAAAEVGIARGYIETVAQSLDDMLARRKPEPGSGEKALGSTRLTSDYFGTEPGSSRTQQRHLESSNAEKKVQASFGFEALLGNEIDNTTFLGYEERFDGECGMEEKSGVSEELAGRAEVENDERESEKIAGKKKKKKILAGGASKDAFTGELEVRTDGVKFSSQEHNTSADNETKTKRSKKKRKSLEGALDNGLLPLQPSPAKLERDEHMEPVIQAKKKKKKQKGNVQDVADVAEERPGETVDEVGGERVFNVSGVEESRYNKKSKKRLIDGSPGDVSDQHRKSKKMKL